MCPEALMQYMFSCLGTGGKKRGSTEAEATEAASGDRYGGHGKEADSP